MGRLDVSHLPYLTSEDIRILTAIEMGMRNHEIVSGPLIIQLAGLKRGGASKKLRNTICVCKLAAYERGKKYDGYRLTIKGYDYLALNTLTQRNILVGVGSKIGVGKESDIFKVLGADDRLLCMKLHRLGRTSFRKLKEKRDYHKGRQMSWLYLSRLSAEREFAYMKALHDRGFPVPEPIGYNRHCVIMELVNGYPLCNVSEVSDTAQLYSDLMDLIVRLANHGVIHCDFNEFNIMVNDEGKPTLIDFPQMVSTKHQNAKMYFDRDVQCIITYFKKKYHYESEFYPVFDRDVKPEYELDKEVEASGYNFKTEECDRFLERINEDKEEENDSDEHSDNDSSGDNSNSSDNERNISEDESGDDGEENFCPEMQIIKPVTEQNPMVNATLDMFFKSMKLEGVNSLTPLVEGRELSVASVSGAQPCREEDTVSVSSRRSKCSNTGQKLDEETRKAMRQSILRATKLKREAKERGEHVSVMELMEGSKHEDDRLSCLSFTTTGSTVDPATLKLRANKEFEKQAKKQVSKKNLRTKGEANAVNRKKRENAVNIKESLACADVWG